MSQRSNHLRLVSWAWQWVHFTPQSPDLNPIEHYGMWWNERFTSWMCSRQICSNCAMLSWQYEPKSLRNVSNTLLNLCHEELRQFWRQKGSNPVLASVPNKVASEYVYIQYILIILQMLITYFLVFYQIFKFLLCLFSSDCFSFLLSTVCTLEKNVTQTSHKSSSFIKQFTQYILCIETKVRSFSRGRTNIKQYN